MKLEPGNSGFVIDAADLAPLLEVEPAEIDDLMRTNQILTQSEKGLGAHADHQRLTFRYNGICVKLTVREDGVVLKRTRTKVPPRTGLWAFLDAPDAALVPPDEGG